MDLQNKKAVLELFLAGKDVLTIADELDLVSWDIHSEIERFKIYQAISQELYLVPSTIYRGDFYLFNLSTAAEKRIQIMNSKIMNFWDFTQFELLWLEQHGLKHEE